MKYIKLFENKESYGNYLNNNSDSYFPNVCLVENSDKEEILYSSNLGSFTLNGTNSSWNKTYYFEKGMTWEEFCLSDYNFRYYGDKWFDYNIFSNPESENNVLFSTNSAGIKNVDPRDIIIDGKTYDYYHRNSHGSGGSN